jgi:2-methylisocitrate lyase-like PEP mutase family enzyme
VTASKYHVHKNTHGWSVVRSVPYIADTEAGYSNHAVAIAETLSEAVQAAQEHAGRALEWKWDDSFQGGEGQ